MATDDSRNDRCINYIEFNVADIARSKEFYGNAFGWTFTDYGPSYAESSDGHMKGGFDAGNPVSLGGPLVVLYGEDLAELQARIEAAGGNRSSNFPAATAFISPTPTATNSRSGARRSA